ncbi:Spc105 protein [Candida orthopsilosis Co 90-125]|uniref:Spc105 protein n=1 Tax=Candida orthopsilosis (strain 90-125) TaxID=1136231 RepID=H8X8F5_CANO9|nr:Spc105 protein [Candida orthopsilosis Co 90-125]CCG24430.1 Spc105 protein [Candida orthopsilosis Co 90-125]
MARSILKDNTAPLPSTSRRVSFAPEVTLHQIEVINPNKRRKTDGGASGYTSLSSESDFEVVHYSSQQELMKEDNDHLMNLSPVGIRNQDVQGDEFNDSSDDGNKPLTDSSDEESRDGGEVTRPELSSAHKRAIEVVKNVDGREETEMSMELTVKGSGTSLEKEKNGESVPNAPLIYASDEDADYSSNDEEVVNSFNTEDDGEEEDMQLTGMVQKFHSHQPVGSVDEPEDMQLTEPITATSRRYRQPSAGSDDDGGDDTINLTILMSKVDEARTRNQIGNGEDVQQGGGEGRVLDHDQKIGEEVDDASNMELTERVSRIVSHVPILKPNLEALPDVGDDEEDEEISVTKDDGDVNTPVGETEMQELVDMEVTEPVRSEAAYHEQEKSINETSTTETQEMELTQPIQNPSRESQLGAVDDQMSQNQDMELTQPVKGLVNKPQPSTSIEENIQEKTLGLGSSLSKITGESDVAHGQSVVSMDFTKRQVPLTDSQQSMELTQTRTIISRHKHGLSPVNGIVTASNSKRHEQQTTTKTSLPNIANEPSQEVSNGKEEERLMVNETSEGIVDRFANYEPVPLSQFLDDVNLKFYTDIDSINRSSIGMDSAESTTHQPPSIYDLISAIPYKEIHALSGFIVKELQNYIRDGEQVFQEFSAQIGNDNLPIMKEFYTTKDDRERDAMIISLNNIKISAKLESKSTWYKWRSTLTRNVIDEMDKQLDLLKQCQKDLDDYLRILDKHAARANEYKKELITKLQRLRNAKQTMGSLSQEQVNGMRYAFSQSKSELKDLAEKVDQAKNKLVQLDQSLVELSVQKRDLLKQVNDVEFDLEKRKPYTREEKIGIKKKYEQLTGLTRLKYARTEGTSNMVFVYEGMVTIKIDFVKHSFQVGEIQSNEFDFKELINHVYRFPISKHGEQKVNPLVEWGRFKSYWRKLVQFDKVLDFIRFQWPVRLISGKEDNDVIRFQFDYFDFGKRKKYIVEGSLAVASLLEFESSIVFTVKPARKFNLDDKEVNETLIKLGDGIDLPQCSYSFVSNI